MSKLKPRGFVIATGLHKLLSKTASHVFECRRDAPGTEPYDVPYAMTGVRAYKKLDKALVYEDCNIILKNYNQSCFNF